MGALEKKPIYDADTVSKAASGRWLEVFDYLANAELSKAMDKVGKHVTCPVNGTTNKGGRGDGFRLFKDVAETGGGYSNQDGGFGNGFKLLMWLKGWDFPTTLEEVAKSLNLDPDRYVLPKQSKPTPKSPGKPGQVTEKSNVVTLPVVDQARIDEIKAKQEVLLAQNAKDKAQVQQRIDDVWAESMPMSRDLPLPLKRWWVYRDVFDRKRWFHGDHIRFHPALPYYEEVGDDENARLILVGKFPAMIAAIRDLSGEIITLHRTYLTNWGRKAPVECPRKMMSVPDDKTVTGSAIQLGGMPTNGILGIAEGMETAMSAARASGIVTWSAVSAGLLEKLILPESVHTVLIWADKDRSETGQKASTNLQTSLQESGIRSFVLMPKWVIPADAKSIDWNDVWLSDGILGFPNRREIAVMTGGAS